MTLHTIQKHGTWSHLYLHQHTGAICTPLYLETLGLAYASGHCSPAFARYEWNTS
jgi:hypothetical protein